MWKEASQKHDYEGLALGMDGRRQGRQWEDCGVDVSQMWLTMEMRKE